VKHARAVVTGASGLLGRRVAARLAEAGANVLGVDPGADLLCRQGYRHLSLTLEQAAAQMAAHLAGGGAFVHLAGMADAGACERDPSRAFAANVGLVAAALDVSASAGGVLFVLPSTGIVYGLGLDRPALETDPPVAGGVYAGTKLAAEAVVRGFAPGRLSGAILARISNVYGPGAGENTVLGRILAQAGRGETIRVADERPVRDFLYVDDVAEALVRLASLSTEQTLAVNVSTGRGTAVGRAADILSRLTGLERRPPEGGPKGAPTSLVLDNTLLGRLTGWTPGTDLESGLAESLNHNRRTQDA